MGCGGGVNYEWVSYNSVLRHCFVYTHRIILGYNENGTVLNRPQA